jgi:hypothetical protein
MAQPTDRDEFTQWCLRALGEPVFEVNVSIEQISDRVDEALARFYERHYHGTEEKFILYNFQKADWDAGFIQLEPDIQAVTDLFIPSPNSGIFSVEYQLQLENLFSTSMVSNYGDLTYYYMTQSNITLINRMFTPMRQYTYNPLTNKLIIAGGNKNTKLVFGGIVIRSLKRIYGAGGDDIPTESNALVYNIWQDRWLQNYATALIYRQWAINLSKLATVPLMGGVQLDPDRMMNQALQDIEKLEKELYDSYQDIVPFLIG